MFDFWDDFVDPEGEFVSLAEELGYPYIESRTLDGRALGELARRTRQHRLSIVLDLSDQTREEQMIAVAAFFHSLIECPREDAASGDGRDRRGASVRAVRWSEHRDDAGSQGGDRCDRRPHEPGDESAASPACLPRPGFPRSSIREPDYVGAPASFVQEGQGALPRLSAPYVPGRHSKRYWTEEKNQILRDHYPSKGLAFCASRLEDRSKISRSTNRPISSA